MKTPKAINSTAFEFASLFGNSFLKSDFYEFFEIRKLAPLYSWNYSNAIYFV